MGVRTGADISELAVMVAERQVLMDAAAESATAKYAGRGGRIFCGKGCAGCCTLSVHCSYPEAVRVAAALEEALVPALEAHVRLLRSAAAQSSDLRSFLRMRRELGACPFLDGKGECAIYAMRPLSCRSLLATREPEWCTADFARLTAEEKELFVEGLDREAVSFPMHYLAETQKAGTLFEEEIIGWCRERFGFALYGNFPYQVWLEREHGLSSLFRLGEGEMMRRLLAEGLLDGVLLSML